MTPSRAAEIAQSFDLRALPDEFFADPYPLYAHLRAHEPVRQMPDGSLFLTRYDDLAAVYRDAKTFSSDKRAEFAPKFALKQDDSALFEHHTTSLVFNDPPLHTQVRRVLMGALTRRAIADMEPGLTALVARLLDGLQTRGGGDLIEEFAAAIPVDIIGNLLGVPQADRTPLRGWSLAILGALEPQLSPLQMEAGNQAVAQFKAYLRDLVAERRQRPGDPEHDVLTRLIQSGALLGGAELSELELLHNCIFILNAGHETTTNLIGNSLVAIAQHASARGHLLYLLEQEKSVGRLLPADLAQKTAFGGSFEPLEPIPESSAAWDVAVDEFLRFESSNQLGNRRAVADFELGGKRYPAGTLVTLCIGAANRDPAQFDAPDDLRLQREPNRHLAFGLGIHQCAGLSLARLEGRVAIRAFLERFPNFQLLGEPQRQRRARFRGFSQAQFTAL